MDRPREFRLGAVLRVRKRQEDLRAQALAEVRRAMRRAELEREEIARTQVSMLSRAGSLAVRGFDAADVRRYFQFERHLARLAVEKDAHLAELQTLEAERLEELAHATKHKRMVERLEARHLDAVAVMIAKTEQRTIDETATNGAARRRTNRERP